MVLPLTGAAKWIALKPRLFERTFVNLVYNKRVFVQLSPCHNPVGRYEHDVRTFVVRMVEADCDFTGPIPIGQ